MKHKTSILFESLYVLLLLFLISYFLFSSRINNNSHDIFSRVVEKYRAITRSHTNEDDSTFVSATPTAASSTAVVDSDTFVFLVGCGIYVFYSNNNDDDDDDTL